jgi:uncharacterized membrane protein
MITTNSVRISAPAEVVWPVFSDVVGWPTWTRSVTPVEPLDGPALEPGRRFRIRQPRLPVLVWRVTDLDPGRSWTWPATGAGATTHARHRLQPDGDAVTVVTQGIDQRWAAGRRRRRADAPADPAIPRDGGPVSQAASEER